MRKRKQCGKPLPWMRVERLASGAKGTPRRHYIALGDSEAAEWLLHATKGWRRFSRKANDQSTID